MKGIVSNTLILLLTCTLIFGQQSFDLADMNNPVQHQCGVRPPTKAQIKHTLDVIDKAAFDRNSGTTQLPIRLHIVTESNGSGGVSLDWVNLCLAQLNNRFYNLSIEWYIADVNYINNSSYYDFEAMTEEEGLCQPHEENDAVNIFFVNSLAVDGYDVCGFSYYPVDMLTSMRMFMRNDCIESSTNGTFVHEFGHFFNLFHTHEGTSNGNTDPNAEHVARTGLQSNCGTAGDLLCDTNADPAGNINSNCVYIDGGTDTYGNTYNPPVSNLMSYYSKNCGWNFTSQQFNRMGNGLAVRQSHNSYDIDGANPNIVTDPSGLNVMINTSYQVVLSWNDNASNETGYLIERSSDGVTFQPLFLGGVGAGVTSYIDSGVAANTMYYYRVKASNDDPDHYSNVANIYSGQLYCIPSHQFDNCDAGGVGVGIQEFDLSSGGNSLMNITSGCDGPLSIFAGAVAPPSLNTEGTYDFNVVYVNSGGVYIEQNISIWLDANQDGDFDDSGELLFQSNLAPPANVFYGGEITIPVCALSGNTTMRVRSRYLPNGPVENPCGFYNFGETEDYPVNILNSMTENIDIALSENSGIPNDGIICDGEEAMITASGGTNYIWEDNSTFPTRIVTSAGTYRVTVTNNSGCSATESIIISSTVSPNATIFISETSGDQDNDGLLCSGASAQLIGAGGSTFLWENNSTQAIRTVSSSGTYAVTVTTSNGCSDDTSVDLVFGTVDAEIEISEFSGDTNDDGELCDGDSALLIASGGSTYSWQDGLTSPSRNVTTSGTYSVTVFDNAGCSDVASVDINVTTSASTTINITEDSGANSNDGELCQGDEATLTATGGTSYLWSDNTTSESINVSIAGNYSVTITSANGCTSVQSRDISVNGIDEATIAIIEDSGNTSNDGMLCSGDIATLIAGNGVNYLWNDGSTATSRTVSSTDTYSVTVSNQFGCQSVASVEVVFDDGPIGQIIIEETSGSQSNDGELCAGDSATLTASGGASYNWSDGSSNSSITVDQGGMYTVTISNAIGCKAIVSRTISISSFTGGGVDIQDNSGNINNDGRVCSGDSAELSAYGGQSYLWDNGSTNANRVVEDEGDYTVTVSNGEGCSSTHTISVIKDNLPNALIDVFETSGDNTNDGIACNGDNVNLQASGGDSYSWDNGNNNALLSVNETGLYRVTVTNEHGCTAVAESSVQVSETITANILVVESSGNQNNDGILCSGDQAQLTATGGLSYIWDDGTASNVITASQTGEYRVTIFDANSCSTIETIDINVNEAVVADIGVSDDSGIASNDGVICSGSSALLVASGGSNYNWSNNNNSNVIDVSQAGQYDVTVTNDNGCSDLASISVIVNSSPTAVISIADTSGLLNNDGELCSEDEATLSATGGSSYLWEDGTSSSIRTISDGGEYALTVVDENGCVDQTTETITVYEADNISISVEDASGINNDDGQLCASDEAILSVTGGADYIWSNGSNNSAIIVSQAGDYTVVSTNQHGCESSASTSISVYDIPDLVLVSEENSGVQQNDNKLCEGDVATLTALTSGSITWEDESNAMARTVAISGVYTVEATNIDGCTNTKEVVIEVFANPEVLIEVNENSGGVPNDGIIDFGDDALLKGTGANSYLWDDGTTVDVRFVSDQGEYEVAGSNIDGCSDSDVATIMFSAVLSLKEIKLDGSIDQSGITLQWNLNSDNHIDDYTIERGTSDHIFEPIGKVDSDNSSEFVKYNFLDTEINAGVGYYYRVRANSFAGENIISSIIYLEVDLDYDQRLKTSIYPNPVVNVLTFMVDVIEEASIVEIDIADERGQILRSNYILDQTAEVGAREYFVDLSQLSKGLYFIKVRVGRTAQTHKVIIVD